MPKYYCAAPSCNFLAASVQAAYDHKKTTGHTLELTKGGNSSFSIQPGNVSLIGFAVVLIGLILAIGGFLFFGQVYSCALSLGTSCPSDVTARFAWAFPLVTFGIIFTFVGAIVSVAGYLVGALRPGELTI